MWEQIQAWALQWAHPKVCLLQLQPPFNIACCGSSFQHAFPSSKPQGGNCGFCASTFLHNSKSCLRAEEIAHWLRTLIAVAEDHRWFPAPTSSSSQLPETPGLGHPMMTSSGQCEYSHTCYLHTCVEFIHTHTCIDKTQISNYVFIWDTSHFTCYRQIHSQKDSHGGKLILSYKDNGRTWTLKGR